VTERSELGAIAKAIVDANSYMTIGTADEDGLPWVTPVWYAPADYREFFWVSRPEARHSRNIATRPRISIVIFDSHTPINAGQAVYMSAVAEELTADEAELERGMGIFSRRSEAQGARPWTANDVRPPAHVRLYRATASEHFTLEPGVDRRIRVSVDS
jgi:nitroimidazol reductase NimA-like FMN-containing flavoprotein (pyridoxamine 5'-phosphate oxidase superfamily)